MTIVLVVIAAIVVGIGAIFGIGSLPEIRRYMKIRKM
jgi:hypothetical protein